MPQQYRPRLRILLDPIYVQIANLTSSSTYHKYVSLARELVKRGHHVYWVIPDVKYSPKEIEDHPNVTIIRSSYIQDQFVIDGLFTDAFFNLFNRVAGKYHIDVLCTSRTSLGLTYKRVLEPPRFHDTDRDYTDKGYGLPTVIIEEFPQTPLRQHTGRAYWLAQCQGYLTAERTIFLSEHNRSECTQAMMEFFRTSVVDNWVKDTRIIPAGIEIAEIDKYYDPEHYKLNKDFKVLSVGRIFGPSYAEFLPWFDYLYRRGRDDVSMTIALSGSLSGPMRAKLKNIGFDFENNFGRQFVVMEKNPRTNILRMMRNYHAFVCPLSHLDHPTGLFECIYLGLPGIMPVSDYQQTFFRDWPWVIKPSDKAALLAHLLWIKDNRDEARAMVAPWRDRIREAYDAPTTIALLADEIEGAAREPIDRFKTSSGVINTLRQLKGEKYSWGDVVAYLSNSKKMAGTGMDVSVGDMSIRTTFTYAASAVHHAMGMAGFVDDCTKATPVFVRRDIFDKGITDANKRTSRKRLVFAARGARNKGAAK